ncbi:polysaccharide pyruvyl transferase family protein [Oceanihabitans sediminis]|uniref:polysaccharide pyruvyl transferase family protein n=1 Tax=Oceanihabitans sediminis TaxID=1812012 RepID=UPI00299E70EE|nr:polysaccharide pyruvyl transferase family protein [Oceanihabitans sediminis]MDX1279326.1 polysaccharide pyruvyl transferase family protein [Oceanihabitans sediminis]
MKVFYYGWDGFDNFGDDYIRKQLFYRYGFQHDENSKTLLIGGGTILPMDDNQLLYKNKRIGERDFDEIIVLGAGVCEPSSNENHEREIKFTEEFLKDSKFIGVRDTGSSKILKNSTVVGDPFYTVDIKHDENVKQSLSRHMPYIILQIGNQVGTSLGGVEGEFDTCKEVLKFAKEYLIGELNYNICILPFHRHDYSFCQYAMGYLGNKAFTIREYLDHKSIFNIFKYAEKAITFRQHGLITGIVTNTPTLATAYHPKVINVAKDFDLENICIRTDELNAKNLFETFDKLESLWDKEKIAKKKKEMSDKMDNFVSEIKRDRK